jgi:hypothetical protein
VNGSCPLRTRTGFGIASGAVEVLTVTPMVNTNAAKSMEIVFLRFMRESFPLG